MPSQRMNRGTQSMDGMARRACRVGSISRRRVSLEPDRAPNVMPAAAPRPKPASTRQSVAQTWVQSSPVLARACSVTKIRLGGGTRRPSARRVDTATSQTAATRIGRKTPSRTRGSTLERRPARDGAAGAAAPRENHAWVVTGSFLEAASVGRGRKASVDEGIDGRAYVGASGNHARLLQRDTGGENRVDLRLSDRGMGQFGAFELPLDHRLRQLGVLDQRPGEFGRVREREGAGLLVGLENLGDERGILLREGFAHVQNAPGVRARITVEEGRSGLDLGGRHQGVEASPRVHVAALQGGAPVRMLEQHELDVLLSELR